MIQQRQARKVTVVNEGDRATNFELFFDLIFVYAITQVTALMADHLTPHGVLNGLLALGVLWWCWCGYTWLGNTVRLDDGIEMAGMFAVMAAMFVVSLTVNEAFDDIPGGLPGPVVFVACYVVVRALHVLLYWYAALDDEGLRRQVLRMIVPISGGALLLMIAAFTTGWTQTALWAAALLWDYTGVLLSGMSGWRVRSAVHFAERHGLIVIIAIGESLVAIGVGARNLPISWPIVVAAILGIAVAGSLWWAYFDTMAAAAEHRLAQARGVHRSTLAAHGYTYLHLPLMAGIILLALGLKKVLEYAGDADHHALTDALHGVGLYALYGGAALYLFGHVLFGRRMIGSWKPIRLAGGIAVLLALPIANFLPALGALALLAGVLVTMTVYESRKYADARAAVRQGHDSGHG